MSEFIRVLHDGLIRHANILYGFNFDAESILNEQYDKNDDVIDFLDNLDTALEPEFGRSVVYSYPKVMEVLAGAFTYCKEQ